MEKYESRKRIFLFVSLASNLSILFFFKYFNFISGNLGQVLDFTPRYLDFLLPVGISFYTFQTMAYTIDVYRGGIKPEKHLGIFALFVSYFPQLVAGPIERAGHLLSQFKTKLHFDPQNLGPAAQMIVWGLFKKEVLADRLAFLVDPIYNDPTNYSGGLLALATIGFAFQIYCDFSGYSDMAIGISKLFGVELMKNFNAPYLARAIAFKISWIIDQK